MLWEIKYNTVYHLNIHIVHLHFQATALQTAIHYLQPFSIMNKVVVLMSSLDLRVILECKLLLSWKLYENTVADLSSSDRRIVRHGRDADTLTEPSGIVASPFAALVLVLPPRLFPQRRRKPLNSRL